MFGNDFINIFTYKVVVLSKCTQLTKKKEEKFPSARQLAQTFTFDMPTLFLMFVRLQQNFNILETNRKKNSKSIFPIRGCKLSLEKSLFPQLIRYKKFSRKIRPLCRYNSFCLFRKLLRVYCSSLQVILSEQFRRYAPCIARVYTIKIVQIA